MEIVASNGAQGPNVRTLRGTLSFLMARDIKNEGGRDKFTQSPACCVCCSSLKAHPGDCEWELEVDKHEWRSGFLQKHPRNRNVRLWKVAFTQGEEVSRSVILFSLDSVAFVSRSRAANFGVSRDENNNSITFQSWRPLTRTEPHDEGRGEPLEGTGHAHSDISHNISLSLIFHSLEFIFFSSLALFFSSSPDFRSQIHF